MKRSGKNFRLGPGDGTDARQRRVLQTLRSGAAGPTRVELALCSACTLACDYCTERLGPPARLPLPRVFELVEECRALGTEVLSLTGGEVTTCEELPEIVQAATDGGLFARITTNGYGARAVDPALLEELVRSGLGGITVSYYAADADLFAAASGRRDALAQVSRCMARIDDLKAGGAELFWNVNVLVDRRNFRQLPETLGSLLRFNGLDRVVPLVVKRQPALFLGEREIEEYYAEVLPGLLAVGGQSRFPLFFREARRLFGTSPAERALAAKGLYWVVDAKRCYHCFDSIFIAPDGLAYHCFVFHIHKGAPLGKVQDCSLAELWERHQRRVREVVPESEPVCQKHRCNPDITAFNKEISLIVEGWDTKNTET